MPETVLPETATPVDPLPEHTIAAPHAEMAAFVPPDDTLLPVPAAAPVPVPVRAAPAFIPPETTPPTPGSG